jgi:fucose permease
MRDAAERARLAVAFGGFVLIGVAAGGAGVLLPAQIADYGVDKTTIGLMFITFSIGYVLSAAANGALLHRFGVRAYVVLGAGILLVAAGLTGLRPGFAVLVALQFGMGFGGGAIDAGLNAYLSTLPRSTALLNYLHAFFGVGALLGPLLAAGLLARHIHWTVFYLLYAVLALPVAAGLLLLYPRARPPTSDKAQPRLVSAFRIRTVWLAAIFLAIYVGIEISVGNWGFSFLTEERQQGVLLAGWVVSGYWLGLTLGRFALNRLAESVGVGVVSLTAGCLAGTVGSALLVWLLPSTTAAGVGLIVLGFFLGPIFPTTIAVVPRIAPARLVATAIGILVGVSVSVGAVFPWLVGAVAQRVGLWSLLPFTIGLAVVLAVLWWRIVRHFGSPAVDPDVMDRAAAHG